MKTIELKNVSKIYKNGVKALDNVSLTVKQGEFIAVMGQVHYCKLQDCLITVLQDRLL